MFDSYLKCITLILGMLLSLSVAAQEYRVALIDFMYVPEGKADKYVEMEKNIALPVHQKLVDNGKMESWSLWSIPYPGGTNAEYHYATIRIYSSNDQLYPSNDANDLWRETHIDKDFNEVMEHIYSTRDLVKTHKLSSWLRFMDKKLKTHPAIMQVVYFKTPLNKYDQYQALEKEVYHPMHQKEIEIGNRAGWEGWTLMTPMGSQMEYSHVAMDLYKDWGQYTASVDSDAIFQEVHPGLTQEEVMQQWTSLVDLVKIEEWHLVESTDAY